MKAPEQAIFDDVFGISLAYGYPTFMYKPGQEQRYPFVYVGQTINTSNMAKAFLYGNVVQMVEVWHDYKNRREVTDIMHQLKAELVRSREAEGYQLALRNYDTEIRMDDSTREPLLQGIIEVEYRYRRKGR